MKKTKIYLSSSSLNESEVGFLYEKNTLQQSFFGTREIICFEKDIENYLKQNSKVACLSSGTAAIHLSLILAGVKQDDEVLCQSFTFSASANPIVYCGAKPIFIDSEKETWNMCPVFLEEAIKNRMAAGVKPKAIIIVHLYGMPAKMKAISAIAKKYKITLIEDAAEALGSTYKNQKCGTFGDFGILSFNGNKIITTSGGGALVCKHEEDKQKAIFLATQARDNAPHYQHSQIGYNYRMSNVLAGIGRGQMEVLDKHVALRRKNNQFYKALFKDVKGITVFAAPTKDYFSNHWLSCVLIDSAITGFTSQELRLQLEKDNIEARPLWKPMHLQPVFKDCLFFGSTISEMLFTNGLCLPSGSNLTEEDLDRISSTLHKFL